MRINEDLLDDVTRESDAAREVADDINDAGQWTLDSHDLESSEYDILIQVSFEYSETLPDIPTALHGMTDLMNELIGSFDNMSVHSPVLPTSTFVNNSEEDPTDFPVNPWDPLANALDVAVSVKIDKSYGWKKCLRNIVLLMRNFSKYYLHKDRDSDDCLFNFFNIFFGTPNVEMSQCIWVSRFTDCESIAWELISILSMCGFHDVNEKEAQRYITEKLSKFRTDI